ncbi:MAG: hypothetical protein AAF677_05560 [Pseudomonadota bacterium]
MTGSEARPPVLTGLRRLALLILALAALLWPIALNGGAIVHFDTPAYLRGGATIFDMATGIEVRFDPPAARAAAPLGDASSATPDPTRAAASGGAPADPATPASSDAEGATGADNSVVTAARSPWYGLLLFLATWLGGSAGFGALQAAAVLTALSLTTRAFLGRAESALPLATALGLATPLGVYTCFYIPDIFAAVTVLAVAALMFLPVDRLAAALWTVLLALALLVHNTDLLIALALILAGAALALVLRWRVSRLGIAALAAGAVLGFGGQVAYTQAAKTVYGYAPVQPPFIASRLITDGPGTEYLIATCPDNGLVFCDYLDRVPVAEVRAGRAAWFNNVFLWSGDPEIGVYTVAPRQDRIAMSAQQVHFAVAVALHDPMATATQVIGNIGRQLIFFSVGPMHVYDALQRRQDETAALRWRTPTLAAQERFPFYPLAAVYLGVLLASIAGAVVLARARDTALRAVAPFLVLVVAGVLVNACITGTLSAPNHRYQGRVVWLIPLVAALMWLRWSERRRAAAAP